MIFTSWAKLSRNYSTASLNRSNTRCMLCPRDFPGYSAKIDNMYVRHSSEECSRENTHPPPLASNGIMDLQFYANKDGKSYTKLEVFSAYLWKLTICTQKVKDTMNYKIGIVVDGCQRLREIGISANYFGNVLILPFIESNACYIKSKPLCWSAGLIHDAIKSAANEEDIQSLIDFVETTKPTPVLAKI
ncbi:coniferyl alcohol acyltransferase-like [Cryptomeria japonica]|uniref:coniferyl alcohol acyltransferase-like n=1 Tax=Cryptomeria japonica TaxID=3369 RepID=UPI0027DA4394|nr:coniferyl alcohol acyltransferase-like [Cryptomeria japonica]